MNCWHHIWIATGMRIGSRRRRRTRHSLQSSSVTRQYIHDHKAYFSLSDRYLLNPVLSTSVQYKIQRGSYACCILYVLVTTYNRRKWIMEKDHSLEHCCLIHDFAGHSDRMGLHSRGWRPSVWRPSRGESELCPQCFLSNELRSLSVR